MSSVFLFSTFFLANLLLRDAAVVEDNAGLGLPPPRPAAECTAEQDLSDLVYLGSVIDALIKTPPLLGGTTLQDLGRGAAGSFRSTSPSSIRNYNQDRVLSPRSLRTTALIRRVCRDEVGILSAARSRLPSWVRRLDAIGWSDRVGEAWPLGTNTSRVPYQIATLAKRCRPLAAAVAHLHTLCELLAWDAVLDGPASKQEIEMLKDMNLTTTSAAVAKVRV